jgi:hypothetical protein
LKDGTTLIVRKFLEDGEVRWKMEMTIEEINQEEMV